MPEAVSSAGYILAFDFGLRRIGVAVGQSTTGTASSLETVQNGRRPDWVALDRLLRDWQPGLLLVGVPLGADGEETPMSAAARSFGAALRERYGLEVAFADERLSSLAAQQQFAEQRAAGRSRRKHAARLDAMAARIILESWMQSRRERNV